jgi:hypothetical protein
VKIPTEEYKKEKKAAKKDLTCISFVKEKRVFLVNWSGEMK